MQEFYLLQAICYPQIHPKRNTSRRRPKIYEILFDILTLWSMSQRERIEIYLSCEELNTDNLWNVLQTIFANPRHECFIKWLTLKRSKSLFRPKTLHWAFQSWWTLQTFVTKLEYSNPNSTLHDYWMIKYIHPAK